MDVKALSVCIMCFATVASDLANAQLLNGPNLPRVRVDDTVNRVQRQISNNIERDLALDPDLNLPDTLDALGDTAVNAVAQLPSELPIVDSSGNTALVEVLTKDGWRALQREWLLYADDRHLPALKSLGLHIVTNKTLPALGITLLRVRAPERLDTHKAMTQALANIDSSILIERNFVYSAQSETAAQGEHHPPRPKALYQGNGRIGIIDTAVDATHPALQKSTLVQRNFVDDALPTPQAHGTAVAGRLLGDYGYAPKASLYSASVFYKRSAYQEGAASHSLLQALDWLLSEKVAVINMSLAGPPNTLLELGLKNATNKGTAIVAAVGNEGPASPPLYPAAYPSVIAVTAVDEHAKIYRWAVQGEHVEIAAHGVGVRTARMGDNYGYESGTSMAAPLITAYFAQLRYTQQLDYAAARLHLAKIAVDKGDKGRDSIFGLGVFAPRPTNKQ